MAVKVLVPLVAKEPSIEQLAAAVTALHDFVIVKPIETKISDVLVESEHWKQDADRAVVIAVGEGRIINGRLFPFQFKMGDVIHITKYGQDISVLGVKCKLIHGPEAHYIVNG